jgi:hemerythrin-like domain-containing protein
MLVPLRLQPAPETPRDAFHLLLDCHERIRTFSDLALRVARLPDVPAAERVEAVTRVERYFSVGLPRHVEDEDISLTHHMREAGLSVEALEALEDMARQHREIEALLETLLPRWRLLRTSPASHEELARELVRDSTRLSALMDEHLRLEERVLFPEARARLSARSVEALGAEMRARRGLKP